LRGLLGALSDKDSVVVEKSALLDRILQSCLGLETETRIAQAEVVPGEVMHLSHRATTRADAPVRWREVRYPTLGRTVRTGIDLRPNQTESAGATPKLPTNTPLTQPYWLRQDHTPGMFVVDTPNLIGQPENPPVLPVEFVFDVGGQTLIIPDEPLQLLTNSAGVPTLQKLDVIPPASIRFTSDVALFAPGKPRSVTLVATAARANLTGTVRLEPPSGWRVSPSKQDFSLPAAGDHQSFVFEITPPAQPSDVKITASIEIGGTHYANDRQEISYPNIPRQLLQPPARLKAVCLDLVNHAHSVGYLPGAGDNVADGLKDMGCNVTLLADDDLTTNKLQQYDAVVIGVRAFNVRAGLAAHLPDLFAYVQAGGTVIVQYNRPDNLKDNALAPYPLHLSNDRVTDETAPVTFLAPEHPALNTPNKITSADFDGWIQERGTYFPNQWDEHFIPILACHDPGEAPLKGSLLVAQYGKGYYVYAGLVFFRQLPAGVPGAYRLMANLISLGK
jgi:hypothetical protein